MRTQITKAKLRYILPACVDGPRQHGDRPRLKGTCRVTRLEICRGRFASSLFSLPIDETEGDLGDGPCIVTSYTEQQLDVQPVHETLCMSPTWEDLAKEPLKCQEGRKTHQHNVIAYARTLILLSRHVLSRIAVD